MLSQRARLLKTSPTLALATKAKELEAAGHDVISLAVGEPDWETFDQIKEAGIQALERGYTRYQPASGTAELRQAICAQVNADLGTDYAASQVSVTSGAKFSVFAALQMLLDEGDEVVIPAPYWVSYPVMVELAGGRAVTPLCPMEQNFKLTAEQLEESLSAQSKVLIFNSPGNPTGAIYSLSELESLARVLERYPQVVILSDDIYNRLVFEPPLAPHLLQVAPQLKDRLVIVNGVSKSYAMTGWRLGWSIGPEEVIGALNKYQSQSVSCASSIAQYAAVVALRDGDGSVSQSLDTLRRRRDLVLQKLAGIPQLETPVPGGAFYIFTNISAHLGKSFQGEKLVSSRDFGRALLEDQKVVAVPGLEFGLEGFLRLSYALSDERLAEAMQRLSRFVEKLV